MDELGEEFVGEFVGIAGQAAEPAHVILDRGQVGAAEVFEGDRDRQRAWMNAPRAAFGGRSALDMIRIGETKAVRRLVISEVDHSALEIAARD